MPPVQPTDFLTRSPHYRTLIAEGAQFKQFGEAVIAAHYGQTDEQATVQAQQLGLVDLTLAPRTGFKGREAIQWVRDQGLEIGDYNNKAYLQNNGLLVARLADTEVLILNDICSTQNQCELFELKYNRTNPARCYSVPRLNSSAWLLVIGHFASEMFAKICGVDLRTVKFPMGAIAQTSVARMNAIIIRNDVKDVPAYHLLFDSASTDYMWTCLKDAFAEFKGSPIGHDAICSL